MDMERKQLIKPHNQYYMTYWVKEMMWTNFRGKNRESSQHFEGH